MKTNSTVTTLDLSCEYDVTVCVFEMCVFEGRGRHVCVCDDDLSDGMCVMCYVCVCVKCTPTHRQVLHTVAVLHSTHRTHSVLAARRRRFGLQTLGRFNTLKHTQNTQNGQHSEHSHSEPASVRNIPEYRGFTLHWRTTWTEWEAVRVFDAHI